MKHRILITGLLLISLLYACSPARKLAEEYTRISSKQTSVYLLPTGYLEKVNEKKFPSDVMEGFSKAQRDSVRIARSLFLKIISDSVFLTRFVNAYMDELRVLGVSVCLDSPDSVQCPPKENAFVVRMHELELREFLIRLTDEQFIYNALYQKDIPLQAISLHAWFSVNRLNKPELKNLLYAENYISDELLDSGFGTDTKDGRIVHYRKTENLSLEKIYNMAEALGRKYASYTYDYLMNEYVFKNLKGSKPATYYHYRFSGRIVPAKDNRFIAK